DTGVGGEAGVDQPRKPIFIVRCRVGGYVTNHRRSNSKIKEPVVSRDRKDQDPDAVCGVAKPVENEGRQKYAHKDVDAQAEPAGADILENFDFAHQEAVPLVGSGAFRRLIRPEGSSPRARKRGSRAGLSSARITERSRRRAQSLRIPSSSSDRPRRSQSAARSRQAARCATLRIWRRG